MSHNTHSTVGQIAGQCVAQRARAGAPATRHQSSRLGISLTEVLIAMGILTVGLLGVAAIFPVAGFYMQKGEVADRGSAIAQAAFNEVISRGMLDPSKWLVGENAGTGLVRYTKSFKDGLTNEIVAMSGAAALPRNQSINGKYGSAYVLDPLGVNGSPINPSIPYDQVRTTQSFPFSAAYSQTQASWNPWRWSVVPPPGLSQNSPKWPLVRVTLPQVESLTTQPMSTAVADRLFASTDDLSLDVPTSADKPSMQMLNKTAIGGSTIPLSRQSRGDYSWIVTVVPPDAEARNALITNPSAYGYEVSVAVFHKRVVDNLVNDASGTERLTRAKTISTGLSGGELLLEAVNTAPDPFGALKTGNWVAVCGPHPASTNEIPRFVMRWYRILSIEGKDRRLNENGLDSPTPPAGDPDRRKIAIRGPEWPWQPAPGGLSDYSHLSNNICVAIVPNVVAVHSKTIKLDGKSAWSMQ